MKATIEIPQGSCFKYEMDKKTNTLHVDRVLNQPVPYNYGFIPNTLCGDGDPVDVFVLGNMPIQPLASVDVELLGVLYCTDNGKEDNKLIAMVVGDEQARHMGTGIICAYLTSYKTGFKISGAFSASYAQKALEDSQKMFQNEAMNLLQEETEKLGIFTNE